MILSIITSSIGNEVSFKLWGCWQCCACICAGWSTLSIRWARKWAGRCGDVSGPTARPRRHQTALCSWWRRRSSGAATAAGPPSCVRRCRTAAPFRPSRTLCEQCGRGTRWRCPGSQRAALRSSGPTFRSFSYSIVSFHDHNEKERKKPTLVLDWSSRASNSQSNWNLTCDVGRADTGRGRPHRAGRRTPPRRGGWVRSAGLPTVRQWRVSFRNTWKSPARGYCALRPCCPRWWSALRHDGAVKRIGLQLVECVVTWYLFRIWAAVGTCGWCWPRRRSWRGTASRSVATSATATRRKRRTSPH